MTSSRSTPTHSARSLIPLPVALGSAQAAIGHDPVEEGAELRSNLGLLDVGRGTWVLWSKALAICSAIDPGNTGGSLVSLDGRLIGWLELGSVSACSAIPTELIHPGYTTTTDVSGFRHELHCESMLRLDDLNIHKMAADYVEMFGNYLYEPMIAPAPWFFPTLEENSARERLVARFRLLRHLPANHDNEGAAAPNLTSVDAAIAFASSMTTGTPASASLNDAGQAVIEFEDRRTGLFADLTFLPAGSVEVYRRKPGIESVMFEDELKAKRTREFLAQEVDVVY